MSFQQPIIDIKNKSKSTRRNKVKKSFIIAVALTSTFVAGTQQLRADDTTPANSQTLEYRLETLEKRQTELENKVGNTVSTGDATIKETSTSSYNGKEGFVFVSGDGNTRLHVGGYIQSDYRSFLSDSKQTGTNQFLVRRARLILEGSANRFVDFRFASDFGNGTTALYDAYADLKAAPWLKLRTGKFKPAVGIEQLQSDTWLLFAERGLPSGLVPNRDEGAQLFGDISGGVISYAAGIFNGATDGAIQDGDTNDEKEYVGRLWLQPFEKTSIGALNKLGFGVSGTNGTNTGTAAVPNLASYKSDGQETFFSYNANVYANGTRSRISPQATWYIGPFGFLGEYVATSQNVSSTAHPTQRTKLTNTSWQTAVSYVLTGESASYTGVNPRHPIDQNGLGAWEVAARYEEFRADLNSFSVYADPTKSASVAKSWTGGLNWYPTLNLKWVLNYVNTGYEKGATIATGTDRPREQVIITRVQVAF